MTDVRSFDVKAYDNSSAATSTWAGADDLRLYLPYQLRAGYLYSANIPAVPTAPPYLTGTTTPITGRPDPHQQPTGRRQHTTRRNFDTFQTFAHEGRMPPLVEDNRLDAQNPESLLHQPRPTSPRPYAGFPNYSSNVGDDNTGVVRLRRVWDTWSTDYSRAAGERPPNANDNGFPSGPPFSPPIYPSYPPPYPAPLRGIQIQIRVADPTNQRIKSLTIRQDFTISYEHDRQWRTLRQTSVGTPPRDLNLR